MTLKQLVSHPEGVLRREELEVVVTGDVPYEEWPNRALRQRLRGIVGTAKLVPLLEIEQERMARPVYDGPREVAELSLDRVHVGGTAGADWYEAELELRGEGTEADMERLIAALRAEAPLCAGTSFEVRARARWPRGCGRAVAEGSAVPGGRARPARGGGRQGRAARTSRGGAPGARRRADADRGGPARPAPDRQVPALAGELSP